VPLRPGLIRGSLAMLFGEAISGRIARYLTRATPGGFPKNDFRQNRANTIDAPPPFPPCRWRAWHPQPGAKSNRPGRGGLPRPAIKTANYNDKPEAWSWSRGSGREAGGALAPGVQTRHKPRQSRTIARYRLFNRPAKNGTARHSEPTQFDTKTGQIQLRHTADTIPKRLHKATRIFLPIIAQSCKIKLAIRGERLYLRV
jgi:hypothetical protein